VCAFWLHLALFALLNSAAYWQTVPTEPSDPVSVDIIAEPPAPATRPLQEMRPPARSRSDSAAVPAPVDAGAPEAPGSASRWVTATSLLASAVLSDPRSAQARKALATLTGEDSGEQLCALEAMEQVRKDMPGFRPTRLAPHAFRNSRRKGDLVVVHAGAIRSNRVWHEIAYRCRLDERGRRIKAFEYAFGKEIDRSLWDEYGLAPIH
jgi:hypothetical protein